MIVLKTAPGTKILQRADLPHVRVIALCHHPTRHCIAGSRLRRQQQPSLAQTEGLSKSFHADATAATIIPSELPVEHEKEFDWYTARKQTLLDSVPSNTPRFLGPHGITSQDGRLLSPIPVLNVRSWGPPSHDTRRAAVACVLWSCNVDGGNPDGGTISEPRILHRLSGPNRLQRE